jgi:MerR family transcriptional regulator, redox-sensitive transcriptional activator SoxR
MPLPTVISIGQMAGRTGLSVSAIRYYEAEGLVAPERSRAGQRRFVRADIRRLSFVLITQRLGFSISEIRKMLALMPQGRTPTQADWTKLSKNIRADLDNRIAVMTRLRDNLDGCIGCGCLSLSKCKLYNAGDRRASEGAGPRSIIQQSNFGDSLLNSI